MTKLELFVCDHCKTQYKQEEDCLKCESNHTAVEEIKNVKFLPSKDRKNYPERIEIKMADGKVLWYKRD